MAARDRSTPPRFARPARVFREKREGFRQPRVYQHKISSEVSSYRVLPWPDMFARDWRASSSTLRNLGRAQQSRDTYVRERVADGRRCR